MYFNFNPLYILLPFLIYVAAYIVTTFCKTAITPMGNGNRSTNEVFSWQIKSFPLKAGSLWVALFPIQKFLVPRLHRSPRNMHLWIHQYLNIASTQGARVLYFPPSKFLRFPIWKRGRSKSCTCRDDQAALAKPFPVYERSVRSKSTAESTKKYFDGKVLAEMRAKFE